MRRHVPTWVHKAYTYAHGQTDRLTDRRRIRSAKHTYMYRHKHIFAYTINTHAYAMAQTENDIIASMQIKL